MQRQLEHEEIQLGKNHGLVRLVCDGLTTPENVGMVFRLADAFGLEKIHFLGDSVVPPNRKIRKTSRGTDAFVPFSLENNGINCLKSLKHEGYQLIGLEITSASRPIQSVDFSAFSKVAILLGSEKHGIQQDILELCDLCVHIPMLGKNSSMNVTHALSIGLFAIVHPTFHT